VRHPDDTWHWLHQHDMVFTRTPDARPLQIIGSSIDITEQRQTVEFVRQQEKALAMLRKRDRLTRELHTMLSQALGTIATHNQSAHDLLQNQHIAPALSHLSDAITMTRQAQTNIQDFIVGTRVHSGPQDTQQEQPGFATALREHCRWLQHLYGFTTTLHIPDILEEVTLSPLTEMHLLHIVQGALSNVRKHAGVAAAQVTLWLQDTWVCVQVTDQGSGFDPNHSLASPDDTGYPGYGLQRMREHVDEIGGHLQVESMVGSGSRITAWVPVYAETSLSALDMRLLLVDDNQLFLEGLRNLLEAHSLTIVGTASSGEEALAQARQLQPDVILMDIEMPGMNGLETTRRIRAELPDIQIVMLTVADNDETLFEAIKIGAIGYLTKNITAEEIYQVLFDLARGGTPLSPGLARRILREFADRDPVESEQTTDTLNTARLTPRQREILTLVVQGHTYKQIGHMLNYSESTIKYHMGNILKNLHLENRADAVAYVRRQMASGLWTRPPDE
jgi:DNA-binding NarL/FixJ family response regulator